MKKQAKIKATPSGPANVAQAGHAEREKQKSDRLAMQKTFFRNAKVRNGAAHKVTTFQLDQNGNLSTAKGYVTVDGAEKETAWNFQGINLTFGENRMYDLVTEQSAKDFLK